MKSVQEKIELTVEWLREQTLQAGLSGLLVGVSGGIDSAVVAGLMKKAFPEQSLGVILPCGSNEKDRQDALDVIQGLDLEYIDVDLTESHQALFGNINDQLKKKGVYREEIDVLNDGNLKARMRMATLYAVAAHYRYLVVGTDNAAEYYTGYFTKYGDGGVDLLPLLHLKKGEVYDWARALGIPSRIIIRIPSAGLWDEQTDEGEMGTTYEMIDAWLDGEKVPEKDLEIIEGMEKVSEHKRHLPPHPPKF